MTAAASRGPTPDSSRQASSGRREAIRPGPDHDGVDRAVTPSAESVIHADRVWPSGVAKLNDSSTA